MACTFEKFELTYTEDNGIGISGDKADWAGRGGAQSLWWMTAQRRSKPWRRGESRTVESNNVAYDRQALADGFALIYPSLGEGLPFSVVSLRLEFRGGEEGFTITAEIQNDNSDWEIRQFVAPLVKNLAPPAETADVLWPNGLGQRFRGGVDVGTLALNYPSGMATMPWAAIAGEDFGLYLGSHDPAGSNRTLNLTRNLERNAYDFSVTHFPYCLNGKTWTMPPVRIVPYRGSWHRAASLYRSWFDGQADLAPAPEWVADTTGWLLGILKQQNGDVMWDYRTGIDQLCDIAEERGLNMLGLFGWAHGGHDYLYPEYIPDMLMGGNQALSDALDRARNRGIRTILYANGVIMDTSTDYYRHRGNDAISLQENTEPYVTSIRKFNSSTPVTFAKACPGSEAWFNQLVALAEQANALGADGILYDQIGVYEASPCFSKNHGHASPATAYAEDRERMVKRIVVHMRAINPEFIVCTEGVFDRMLTKLPFFHGWGFGCSPHQVPEQIPTHFPELFRFTFPELIITHRYAQPGLDRHNAHYATLYGLRYELESRYPADVKFLRDGKLPAEEEYDDTTYWPPEYPLLVQAEAEGEKDYMPKLITFCRRQSDFLFHGKFEDENGFSVTGDDVRAKAFRASDGRMGVVVWNPGNAEATCRIDAPNVALKSVDSPEHLAELTADGSILLPRESVCLVIFSEA